MTVFALPHLLERAVSKHPEKEAVRSGDDVVTYEQLYRRATSIAAVLVDAGVERGDRVGLYLPKGVDAVTAIYGIMATGAAYVPIDPSSPVLRAATIARDCTVSAVVTTPDRVGALLSGLGDHRPRVVLLVGDGVVDAPTDVPAVDFAEAARSGMETRRVPLVDTDLAYLLYTSGTTSVPKGVMLTHRHALTFVDWCAATIGTGPGDRFSNHAPFHFDLSVFDLFVAAHGAASVSVVPEEWAFFGRDLARFLDEEQISVWYSVPSALMMLTRAVREGEVFEHLRSVVFAGEVYPTKHLRALRTLVPNASMWNLYGPTETNVCTYLPVAGLPDDDGTIPIGRACENTEVFAITETGATAGIGEAGELYVRGSSVMKGYWGRPERSAEVLVEDPRGAGTGDRVYRTGDLVRLRSDGDFDFLGRRDHQIKSRGYRIELGEVEAALNADPRLDAAVATAVPHDGWGSAIVAIVIPKAGHALTEIDIKRGAARHLPRYMIPARVEIRESLPRTSTGKVDRRSVENEALSRAWSWD